METATLPSALLADYEVLETLRHGPRGTSVKARQRGTDHLRVVKFMRGRAAGGDTQRLHFKDRVNELARYRPEQFGRIDEIGTDETGLSLVRDFIEGESLEERLQGGPL